jgi:HAMP domain-containing protein
MEERQQAPSQQKFKRSIFSVLTYNIPGAREFVMLLFVVLTVFLLAIGFSSYLFIKAIQIGNYAEYVITAKIPLILFFWAVIWMVAFLYAMHSALQISYRVAGPIKRIERLLDEILNGKDTRIILRDKDALAGIAQRINKLLDLLKGEKLQERQATYQQYQDRIDKTK